MSRELLGVWAQIDARESVHRKAAVLGGVGLTLATSCFAALLISTGLPWVTTSASMLVSMLWVVAWASWASPPKADHRIHGPVRLADDALTITDGKAFLSHGAFSTRADNVAASWSNGEGHLVLQRNDDILVTLQGLSEEQRVEIERRLQCSVRHCAATFLSYDPPEKRRGAGCTTSLAFLAIVGTPLYGGWAYVRFAAASANFAGLFLPLIVVLFVLNAAWRNRRRRVIVGQDGLWLPSRQGRRFVLLGDVDQLDGRKLALKSGESLTLAGRVDGLADRIAQLKAHVAALSNSLDASLLERRGRTLHEWSGALRSLPKVVQYRTSGWSVDSLMAIVEDPSRTPEQRIAAAFAACANGDEQQGMRVLIAADASADAELETALIAAAELELLEDEIQRSTERHLKGRIAP